MERYDVKLYARAYQDLDEIYAYIAGHLLNPSAATQLIDALDAAISSLNAVFFAARVHMQIGDIVSSL